MPGPAQPGRAPLRGTGTSSPDYPAVGSVVLPSDDPLLALAGRTYAEAVGERTGTTPRVVVGPADDPAATTVLLGAAGTGDQGYRLTSRSSGVTVEAAELANGSCMGSRSAA